MRSVELFSGCGGLALGTARAGFRHLRMAEWNADACATLALNQARGVEHAAHWDIVQGDVRSIDWREIAGPIDLVAGGPPCQPFSIGGKHRGRDDGRDMWPEAIRAVEQLRPRAFLFENVRGLARPAFSEYLASIVRRLENVGEGGYSVVVLRVNAADFGAPQKRHRVVVTGRRFDEGGKLSEPVPSHSRERLLWDQWVTGEYWARHGMKAPDASGLAVSDAKAVARLKAAGIAPREAAWVTVRDCLRGLGEPNGENAHVFQPGARVYVGHTGSPLDEPAKALKAGDHGVPGGENMMVRDDGSVRYFTVREAARLQGLPDDWAFSGAWSESMRQIGNAVPVQLAEALGNWMRRSLDGRTDAMRRAA